MRNSRPFSVGGQTKKEENVVEMGHEGWGQKKYIRSQGGMKSNCCLSWIWAVQVERS